MELAFIFLTGILLSFHCVGMCGGFVALLAVRPANGPASVVGIGPRVVHSSMVVLPQQLVFHAGRIATYAVLGGAAGGIGSLSTLLSHTGRAQAVLMVAAGAVMLSSGLALAGMVRHWSLFRDTTISPRPWLKRTLESVVRLPRQLRALPLGALLGLLPCGLIYAMLSKAASTGSAGAGALVMLAFGAGTVPALLLVAFFADLFSPLLRENLVRVSGGLLAFLGGLTLYRGIWWLLHPAQVHALHGLMHSLSN